MTSKPLASSSPKMVAISRECSIAPFILCLIYLPFSPTRLSCLSNLSSPLNGQLVLGQSGALTKLVKSAMSISNVGILESNHRYYHRLNLETKLSRRQKVSELRPHLQWQHENIMLCSQCTSHLHQHSQTPAIPRSGHFSSPLLQTAYNIGLQIRTCRTF
jgi:hypothetical protein